MERTDGKPKVLHERKKTRVTCPWCRRGYITASGNDPGDLAVIVCCRHCGNIYVADLRTCTATKAGTGGRKTG